MCNISVCGVVGVFGCGCGSAYQLERDGIGQVNNIISPGGLVNVLSYVLAFTGRSLPTADSFLQNLHNIRTRCLTLME